MAKKEVAKAEDLKGKYAQNSSRNCTN